MDEETAGLELDNLNKAHSADCSTSNEEELLICDGEQEDSSNRKQTMKGSEKLELKKELTIFSGVGFVVGGIIGSGIFITPKTILLNTGSFGLSMIAWIMGAMIAMAGSLCYVELGLLIRKSGGEYVYLLEAYSFNRKHPCLIALGSVLAFLYSWASVFIMRGTSMAVLLLTFAHYLTEPFYIDSAVPEIIVKLVGLCGLTVLTLLNCYSVKLTARFMTVFAVLKVFAIMLIVGLGLHKAMSSESSLTYFHHPFQTIEGFTLSPSSMALGLYGVLWAFDGWTVLNYVTEEAKNVERTLPLSLFIGIPIVAVCYLAVNFAYFSVLTYEEIQSAEAVAIPFGVATMGKAGLVIIPLLVALSTFSSANASIFGGSRLIFSAAREGALPHMFTGIHTTFETPVPSILLMSALSALIMMIGKIEILIDGFAVTAYLFYLMAILGLLIMRVTRPNQPRPFKAAFIVPIAIFVALCIISLIFLPLLKQPGPSLLTFGLTLLGVPVYIFLVMETPWKLRPKILDRISDWLAGCTNTLLNSQ